MPPRSLTRSEEVRKGRFAPQQRHVFLPQSGHQRESNDTCAAVPLQVAALRWIGWPVSLEYAALLCRLDHPDATAVVWSLWRGYWLRANPLKTFCNRWNIDPMFIHSGGHASEDDLLRLVNAVAPGVVVPIHTENAHRFAEVFPRVRLIDDGTPAEVSP